MADQTKDAITIDNFTTKLSKFDPTSNSNQLYGLVDMGSNGIRCSISDLSQPQSRLLSCVFRERIGISLYDALHESTSDSKPFYFSATIITQVTEALARFKKVCDAYGVEGRNISVFATEAMRTAKNKDEMVAAINQETGLKVDILSPEMESLFGAMGARSGFNQVDGLFMDLGGGSVQMTYVDSSTGSGYDVLAAQGAKSLPFGAARLTALASDVNAAKKAKADLQERMKETFEGMKERFPRLKDQAKVNPGVTIYFCGGGFRGYGSMLMHTDSVQPYPIPVIGGYTVPGHRFVQWKEMLKVNDHDGKIYGLSKRRREQFHAIVEVVQALVEAVPRIKQVIFCSGGNREGILYMKLPSDVRESNPIPLLPGGAPTNHSEEVFSSVIQRISLALPSGTPSIFTQDIQSYIVRNIWVHQGDADDSNSSRALHNPISGSLAGQPGLTHLLRAVLALTMCARWGSDLGSDDGDLRVKLQALVGPDLAFWCNYIGAVTRAFATIIPTLPQVPLESGPYHDYIWFKSDIVNGLGKKGHKSGIELKIIVPKHARRGIDLDNLEDMFSKVGKGLHLGWVVEAKVQ